MIHDIGIGNIKNGDKGIAVCRPSVLGNPFPTSPTRNRQQSIKLYDAWLVEQLKTDTPQRQEIERLAILATKEEYDILCYCMPLDCHTTIVRREIIKMAEALTNESTQ